jgi:hypothetical protein
MAALPPGSGIPGSAGARHLSFPEPPDSTADDARHFRIEGISEGINQLTLRGEGEADEVRPSEMGFGAT